MQTQPRGDARKRPRDRAVPSGAMVKKKEKKRSQKPVPESSKVGPNPDRIPDKRLPRATRRPDAARNELGARSGAKRRLGK